MPVIIGVDVGGTNTDAVAIDLALSGIAPVKSILSSTKTLTTPDTSQGIIKALESVIGDLSPERKDEIVAVNVGTTHFLNAVIEKDVRKLARIAVLRLAGPYGREVPPYAGLPNGLRQIVEGFSATLPGGIEIDGREIEPVNEAAVRRTAEEIRAAGINDIAVVGVYSPIDSVLHQEQQVADILRSVLGDGINITLSHKVAGIGFIERENATILNATILPFARRTIGQFQRSIRELDIAASLFLTRNDGTLISARDAAQLPVSTFLSGPTNSLTGAVFLASTDRNLEQGALVLDIGGTTSDVCAVEPSGLPRPAAAFSHLAGVRTNFAVSDLRSVGLGGGSLVQVDGSGAVAVGPRSVGKDLTRQARVFGGQVLTATDIIVASGRTGLGDKTLVSDISDAVLEPARQEIKALLERAVDEMKTTSEDILVILVGGGSILCPESLKGVSEILRHPLADVANAVGAAMAKVSGSADTIIHYVNEREEEEAVARCRQQAILNARQSGAEEAQIVEETILPVPYVSTRSSHISVRAVGRLSTAGFAPREEQINALGEDTDGIYSRESPAQPKPELPSTPDADAIDPRSHRPNVVQGRWRLSHLDLDFIAEGCAILGCGGGGDVYASHLSAKATLAKGGSIEVVSPESLPDDVLIPAVAVMGSPSTFSERLPSGDELRNSVAAALSSKGLAVDDLGAVMSLEIGGSNGLRGIQAALWTGKPLVDADLMGRAYPNLWQVTPTNADIVLTPAAASDAKGNTVVQVRAASNREIEDMLRAVCVRMGQAAGISLGLLTGLQVKQHAAQLTVSLAWRLGRAAQLARVDKQDVAEHVLAVHPGRRLLTGKMISVARRVRDGFTEGAVTIAPFEATAAEAQQEDVRVDFQNENIHVYAAVSWKTLASVPDLIVLLDAEDGRALGTQDYRYGLRVHVLALAASPQWTDNEGLRHGGPEAFGLNVEYVPVAKPVEIRSVVDG